MHSVLNEFVKMYLDYVEDWVELIPLVQFCYNTAIYYSTGYPPNELILGFRP